MPNYTKHTPSRGSDSMPQKERYLTDKHGDLHQVIPEMLESRTQYEVAKELSDTVVYVSQAWVSDWLRGGNAAGTVYRQKRRWVPVGEAS